MDKVEIVSYSSYGGMDGGSYSIRVTMEDKKVEVENRPTHQDKNMVRVYKYDELDNINRIVNEYHLLDAVPINEEIIHASDAPSTSLYIKSGDKSISFRDKMYSDEVYKGMGELMEYLRNLEDEEHLVDEHEKENTFMGMGMGFIGISIPKDK